jgi:hypothetical protein
MLNGFIEDDNDVLGILENGVLEAWCILFKLRFGFEKG